MQVETPNPTLIVDMTMGSPLFCADDEASRSVQRPVVCSPVMII